MSLLERQGYAEKECDIIPERILAEMVWSKMRAPASTNYDAFVSGLCAVEWGYKSDNGLWWRYCKKDEIEV